MLVARLTSCHPSQIQMGSEGMHRHVFAVGKSDFEVRLRVPLVFVLFMTSSGAPRPSIRPAAVLVAACRNLIFPPDDIHRKDHGIKSSNLSDFSRILAQLVQR